MGLPRPKKEDAQKREILEIFQKLSCTLDILTNLNFTPKYTNEPAKIITNVSTINVEEKIPIFISDQNRLAP